MKTKFQNKKFAEEEEVLQVNLKDADGNPIENEKELTEEQINFAAKMAHAMYKKFSASKVRKFDAEKEEINVILPEDIEDVNIDQVATEAAEARDAEAPDEVTVTVEDEDEDETPNTEANEEVTEFCDDMKEFAAKMRKFARKSKKFDAEELEPIKEALEEVTDAVEDLVENDETPAPAEPETAKEFCKQFSATLKKLREGKKFSAEDLTEVEKIEGELEDVVEEINDTVVESEEANADGVSDIKNFTARKIAQQIGAGNLADFKANFLARK